MRKVLLTSGDALIVTDIQNDFLPGGRLAVPNGHDIVGTVNQYIKKFTDAKRPVFAVRDWHPPDHCSFEEQGGPWPVHCVAGTAGAAFAAALRLPGNVSIISKACDKDKEAYSGFSDTSLHQQLSRLAIQRLFICGLATEYCVINTVKDAIAYGYTVVLLKDAIQAINAQPNAGSRAIKQMQQWGVEPITLQQIIDE